MDNEARGPPSLKLRRTMQGSFKAESGMRMVETPKWENGLKGDLEGWGDLVDW